MIDFVLLCREQNFPHIESGHHHCVEGWVQTHCPFCGDGQHGWHLGFSLEYGNMNCWRCGKHTVWEWLCTKLPPGQRSQAGQILKRYSTPRRMAKKKEIKTRRRSIKAPPGMSPLSVPHRKYLERRGFDPRRLELTWTLKGTRHLSQDWNWRIIAPIRNRDGRIVACTGRALSNEVKPKWKTSHKEEMGEDPKRLLYGIEKADPKRGVLIVEGPSDVWRMGPGAVATLGIDWKSEQAAILRQFSRRFIMFDPEPVALKRAMELANWLAPFPGETEVISGIECDPGDFSQEMADLLMWKFGLKRNT